jgi:hypothetical protein
MKTWSAEELKEFLERTKDDPLHALWHLLAMTGLRRGEALGLRWEDVDLQAGSLSVRRALIPNGRKVVVSEPKTARSCRLVVFDPETVEVLKWQAARQLAHQLEQRDEWIETGLVFTKESGDAWHPEVVSRFFRQALKRSLLPTIRPHDLRHTHATLALRAGIHPKVVSERLGHATVSITLDTYSHAIRAMQEEAATRLADLVFAAKKTPSRRICLPRCRHGAGGRSSASGGKRQAQRGSLGGGDRSRTGDGGLAVPFRAYQRVSPTPCRSRKEAASRALSYADRYPTSRFDAGAESTSRGQKRGQRRGQQEIVKGHRAAPKR